MVMHQITSCSSPSDTDGGASQGTRLILKRAGVWLTNVQYQLWGIVLVHGLCWAHSSDRRSHIAVNPRPMSIAAVHTARLDGCRQGEACLLQFPAGGVGGCAEHQQ